MSDRVMALIAFLTLAGFLAVLVAFVPRLDLGAFIAITLALVAYDFFLRRGAGRP